MFSIRAIAFRLCFAFSCLAGGITHARDGSFWNRPGTSLIVDAYELNIIDWQALLQDKRIAGFISKASDGLPEVFDCTGEHRGDSIGHCKTMWRKYAVSRELYSTRHMIASQNKLLWGSYHVARPGRPVDQANHYLEYASPGKEDLMILDIEGIDASQFMSLSDAQVFVGHIKARTGRYPILYTNHDTARYIATYRRQYPILARLPIWYARYKPEIGTVFPLGNWKSYFLWQFSSAANCSRRHCPYRVAGTLPDIDVSVSPLPATKLAAVWPQGQLLPSADPEPELILAKIEFPGVLPYPAADRIITSSVLAGDLAAP